jgi:hypothetical protein
MKALSDKQWDRIKKILDLCQEMAQRYNLVQEQTRQLEELARIARETGKSQTHKLKDILCVSMGDFSARIAHEITMYNKENPNVCDNLGVKND